MSEQIDTKAMLKEREFIDWIKNIAIYLLPPFSDDRYKENNGKGIKIASIYDYDRGILKNYKDHWHNILSIPSQLSYFCVVGKGASNIFVPLVVENIFPIGSDFKRHYHRVKYCSKYRPFGEDKARNKEWYENALGVWRDLTNFAWRSDIDFPEYLSDKIFNQALSDFLRNGFTWKAYNIFWNLFLLAIDDDLYNLYLPDVVELAYIVKFNNDMIYDWCKAVDYVISRNQFNEDCNINFRTTEANIFFLHQENL